MAILNCVPTTFLYCLPPVLNGNLKWNHLDKTNYIYEVVSVHKVVNRGIKWHLFIVFHNTLFCGTCIAVHLYQAVTLPFPVGDRLTQDRP